MSHVTHATVQMSNCLDQLLKLFVIASDCKCTSNELIFMLKVIFHWTPSKCNCTGYATICSRAMDLFKQALHVFAFARVHSLSRAQTYLDFFFFVSYLIHFQDSCCKKKKIIILFKLSKHMQFGAVEYIYMAKK